MDLYTKVAYAHSRELTLAYSTSFGLSSRLFSKALQPHIYALYGLVRIADEIVDTYGGTDAGELLHDLEGQTYKALESGYATNPIVHAFAQTARQFSIDETLIAPFFQSMRMDLEPQNYTEDKYKTYIHGSAEVIGLMCLRIFCDNNDAQYADFAPAASALGSAYQKVNFLRDLSSDYTKLGRLYFPGVRFETFDERTKNEIIADIKREFAEALPKLKELPASCRKATLTSYVYYQALLEKLEETPADVLKTTRMRIPDSKKVWLMASTIVNEGRLK